MPIINKKYYENIIDEYGNITTFDGIPYDKNYNIININERLYDINNKYIGWPGNIDNKGLFRIPYQNISSCCSDSFYLCEIKLNKEDTECKQLNMKKKLQIKIATYVRNKSILESIK